MRTPALAYSPVPCYVCCLALPAQRDLEQCRQRAHPRLPPQPPHGGRRAGPSARPRRRARAPARSAGRRPRSHRGQSGPAHPPPGPRGHAQARARPGQRCPPPRSRSPRRAGPLPRAQPAGPPTAHPRAARRPRRRPARAHRRPEHRRLPARLRQAVHPQQTRRPAPPPAHAPASLARTLPPAARVRHRNVARSDATPSTTWPQGGAADSGAREATSSSRCVRRPSTGLAWTGARGVGRGARLRHKRDGSRRGRAAQQVDLDVRVDGAPALIRGLRQRQAQPEAHAGAQRQRAAHPERRRGQGNHLAALPRVQGGASAMVIPNNNTHDREHKLTTK